MSYTERHFIQWAPKADTPHKCCIEGCENPAIFEAGIVLEYKYREEIIKDYYCREHARVFVEEHDLILPKWNRRMLNQ